MEFGFGSGFGLGLGFELGLGLKFEVRLILRLGTTRGPWNNLRVVYGLRLR